MDNGNLTQSNKPVICSRNIVPIVFSILITAFLVGGVVYAWQVSILNQTEQSLQTEITTLRNQVEELQFTIEQKESIATQNNGTKKETTTSTSLQAYSNEEFGYSIQYPSDWEAKEYNETEVYISYPGWRQMPEGGGSVVFSIEDKTLEQFIEEYNTSDVLDDGTPLSGIIKQESYTLNGVNGYKLVGTTAIGLDQSFIFISRANKSYVIRFHDYDDEHLKIIETFTFTD